MDGGNRFRETPVAGRGTPEDEWQAWLGDNAFSAIPLTECDRMIVVAPHPDDEVVGVGALVATAAAHGTPVVVVAVTDGAASHPGSPSLSPDALATARIAESNRATALLGVGEPLRLGLPDGEVDTHERELTARLVDVLTATCRPGERVWVLATWRGDGHPDHESTGRAAAESCSITGHRLVEYPVWMWHWARPTDAAVPWERMRVLTPAAEILARKRRAVDEFRTQILPLSEDARDAAILPPWVLARLLRTTEGVFW
ncbi:PIG-L deacetylase family protein [Rhodococcus jostii]|uniref:N-acetylglucosaminyl deacetylase, LmbE family n=1 Tax=Rhodococcus jostii TaxID=132919 RepID=A0A1H5MHB9_RHOJO|nr:PIG-L family deacetylase [Rhodococcus jostii]SEE88684.1 N-acetylglucosaminyl deacetylase, LmbE family [Rhodococcus jostii]